MPVDVAVRAAGSVLMILLPLGLLLALTRHFRLGLGLVGAGALTFVGSQVFHLPFNAWGLSRVFQALGLQGETRGLEMVWVAILLGLSAGIFEESARYLVYRYWLRDVRSWRQAVLFGAGHGGTEAILLGGLALLTLFQASSLRYQDLAAIVPAEQVELTRQQLEAYWAASWGEALLPALERVLAMALHVSLAVMVLRARLSHSLGWFILAILWHTVANAAGLLALQWWGAYAAEAAIAVVVMGALGVAWRARRADEAPPEETKSAATTPALFLESVPPKPEDLEDSRYVG